MLILHRRNATALHVITVYLLRGLCSILNTERFDYYLECIYANQFRNAIDLDRGMCNIDNEQLSAFWYRVQMGIDSMTDISMTVKKTGQNCWL